VSRLGEGGMGEVWRAEHRLLARHAAIKLIRPEGNTGPEGQERFRREAQTLATLRSRNTIELFDYGVTDDGLFFYVMELLDGMDLETLVTRFGPQPPARVCSILMQACNSLAEAHASGLVHRDIKPANLYLCRAADEVDVLKVLDFGLVRSLADTQSAEPRSLAELQRQFDAGTIPLSKLTAAGAIVGTPDYMAPEQILGHDADGRADIYALGCVAYFALTGAAPFPNQKDSVALFMAHLQQAPRPLDVRGLPPAMAELILRCMAKSPADRPPSASVIKHALMAVRFADADAWTEEAAADFWDRNVPRMAPAQPSIGPLAQKSQ
jgi:serine/threonine-protein kinase